VQDYLRGAGHTQIGKVLTHVSNEHAREKVAAVIFVGDATRRKPRLAL